MNKEETSLAEKLADKDWFNSSNKEVCIQLGKDIELELDNMERKALNPDAYWYHKKRLSVLKGKLTRLYNKDLKEWLQAKIEESRCGEDRD